MSIEANVSKKWLIPSHQVFYKYLENKHNILDKSVELRVFRDHMFLSKHGCACTSEENEKVSLSIYRELDKLDSSIWQDIKEDVGCTSIIFRLDDKILFVF